MTVRRLPGAPAVALRGGRGKAPAPRIRRSPSIQAARPGTGLRLDLAIGKPPLQSWRPAAGTGPGRNSGEVATAQCGERLLHAAYTPLTNIPGPMAYLVASLFPGGCAMSGE